MTNDQGIRGRCAVAAGAATRRGSVGERLNVLEGGVGLFGQPPHAGDEIGIHVELALSGVSLGVFP